MDANQSCAIPGLGPETYARWRGSDVGAITDELEWRLILELAGDVKNRRVLDLGCGDGAFALALAQRGALVTGIDASPDMVGAARARAAADKVEATFQVATADQLPLPTGRFDLVVAITILCFVGDATPVFGEIARVLAPGGRLVIGELGKWSTWAAARRVRAWCGSPMWRRGRFRTSGELRALAEAAGLAVESVRGAVYYPRWTPAARLMGRFDLELGRLTTVGAGFVALAAAKAAVPVSAHRPA